MIVVIVIRTQTKILFLAIKYFVLKHINMYPLVNRKKGMVILQSIKDYSDKNKK